MAHVLLRVSCCGCRAGPLLAAAMCIAGLATRCSTVFTVPGATVRYRRYWLQASPDTCVPSALAGTCRGPSCWLWCRRASWACRCVAAACGERGACEQPAWTDARVLPHRTSTYQGQGRLMYAWGPVWHNGSVVPPVTGLAPKAHHLWLRHPCAAVPLRRCNPVRSASCSSTGCLAAPSTRACPAKAATCLIIPAPGASRCVQKARVIHPLLLVCLDAQLLAAKVCGLVLGTTQAKALAFPRQL